MSEYYNIITSAKEVMFLLRFVCEFVCAFVCEQDNPKTYGRILMKFSGYVWKGKKEEMIQFWDWYGSLPGSSGSMKCNF